MCDYKQYNESKYKNDYWAINRSQFKWFSNYVRLRIFRKLIANVKKKEVFVDIGGGVGNWAFHFLDDFEKVIVLDISKKALDRIPEKKILKIEGSITNIPLENNSVDCILLADVLEHLKDEDLDKVISELKGILGKDGRIIIFTSQYGFGMNLVICRMFNKMQGRLTLSEIKEGHLNRMKLNELKNLLKRNNLSIEKYFHYGIFFQPATDFIKDKISAVLQGKTKGSTRPGQELKNKVKTKTGMLSKMIFTSFSLISYLDILFFGKILPGSSIFIEVKHST